MNHKAINEFSVYLAELSEFARLLLSQHFVVLRGRALIIYCADRVDLEETLDCLGYVSDGLNMIADKVILEAPDFAPIIVTERCCRGLNSAKLTRTRIMLEKRLTN